MKVCVWQENTQYNLYHISYSEYVTKVKACFLVTFATFLPFFVCWRSLYFCDSDKAFLRYLHDALTCSQSYRYRRKNKWVYQPCTAFAVFARSVNTIIHNFWLPKLYNFLNNIHRMCARINISFAPKWQCIFL